MTARSLTEVVKLRGKVSSLLLNASRDLVCTNLWCEHVSGPCVCRLERTLQALDPNMLTTLELRDNKLVALPPSLARLTALQHLDLRGNSLPARSKELNALSSFLRRKVESNDQGSQSSIQQNELDSNTFYESFQRTDVAEVHLGTKLEERRKENFEGTEPTK
jgi:Leucine-rich repeat (LRR) protein